MIHPCYICKRSISDSPGRSVHAAVWTPESIVLALICFDCDEEAGR